MIIPSLSMNQHKSPLFDALQFLMNSIRCSKLLHACECPMPFGETIRLWFPKLGCLIAAERVKKQAALVAASLMLVD